jgi:bleomycin hydrolase
MGRHARTFILTFILAGMSAGMIAGGANAREDDRPVYKPAYQFPVLRQIEAARDSMAAIRDSLRQIVDERYEQEAKQKKADEVELRLDWTKIKKPESPDVFKAAFHFPPVPQYYTGTCWAFCSTSFMESEVQRLSGREIKLSEMWTVYWEYVEKARRFVREYSHSAVAEGSQDHGTVEIYRLYGAVPAAAYSGVLSPDGRYDHEPLAEEIRGYLQWMQNNRYWDEEIAIANVRNILNRYMGTPPESFVFEGRSYTPTEFLTDVLKLDLAAYVGVVSTMKQPFGQYVLLDVEDNWRRLDNHLNLPLDVFYRVIKESLQAGYTVSIGGDVSEPGLDGMEDAAVIPSFDIPSKFIDQGSREFRIENGTTGDDHGVHVVGFKPEKGRDWFLIKDSNRSSRLGRYKGYYFYDGDYIKLKMLSFMVHKDRLRGLLPQ